MFKRIYQSVKKHAWWISIVGVPVISACTWWVGGVNATNKDVVELKVILPRIETNTNETKQAVTKMQDDVSEVKERVARIEGGLKK